MDGTEMRKSRFTQEQIVGFIKLVEAGGSVKELGRTHGFSDASFYKWRATYGGMTIPQAKVFKGLESENAKLKRLLAEAHLDIHALKTVLRGK
jgi:putative transposase